MPNEVWMWILTALVGLLSATFGVVWKMLREESKQHAENIKLKADKDKLTEAENRWEKMYDRQERQHEKDKEDMKKDFMQRIDTMENNIMGRIDLLMKLMNHDKN